jgi:hypothetical protein
MRVPLSVLAILSGLALGGCESVLDGSKDEFSKEFTCPLDRIEARPRPDLRPSSLNGDRATDPPKDIAADPDRRRMWQTDHETMMAREDARDDVFELRGCGRHVLYACHRFKGGNRFMCRSMGRPKDDNAPW